MELESSKLVKNSSPNDEDTRRVTASTFWGGGIRWSPRLDISALSNDESVAALALDVVRLILCPPDERLCVRRKFLEDLGLFVGTSRSAVGSAWSWRKWRRRLSLR
jgi:hypothetical protein